MNIQLNEEHEIKADLEIENIKLKKRIQKLQTSLELVNNNCYDVDVEDEVDDHLEMTETSEADTTICSNGGFQDFSSIQLLGEKTLMNQTGLLSSSVYTATTPNLLPLSARRDAQVPPRSNVKHTQTYTKQARRRHLT